MKNGEFKSSNNFPSMLVYIKGVKSHFLNRSTSVKRQGYVFTEDESRTTLSQCTDGKDSASVKSLKEEK